MSGSDAQHTMCSHLARSDDFLLVDRERARTFDLIGEMRHPFKEATAWPDLDEQLRQLARHVRNKHGGEAWRRQGGIVDEDDQPTFSYRSMAAGEVASRAAESTGGIRWGGLAIRLQQVPASPEELVGLAISMPLAPNAHNGAEVQIIRRRLWHRATRLLWAIHHEVIRCRRSTLIIPDVALGEVIWGPERGAWPKDWRRDLMDSLTSLVGLTATRLRLRTEGWSPRITGRSALLSDVYDLAMKPAAGEPVLRSNDCGPDCPMRRTGTRHNHILVHVGLGFLGQLELCAVPDQDGVRRYPDLENPPGEQQQEKLKAARKQGEIARVHYPTAAAAGGGWNRMTRRRARIVQGLVREITRDPRGRADREDDALLVQGSQVPTAKSSRRHRTCPLLDAAKTYVAFNGNGGRKGMGYRLIGKHNGGWLWRFGIEAPTDESGRHRVIRDLLADLAELTEATGLVVVGLDPGTGAWYGFDELRRLLDRQDGLDRLLRLHIRFYAPPDYADRLRCWTYGDSGGGSDTVTATVDVEDLRAWLRSLGVSQAAAARELGLSPQFLSQLLKGQRRWPAGKRQAVVRWMRQRAG